MASLNYMDRQGVVKGSKMNRLNVRSLVTTKVLKDHLDLSVGVNARYGKAVGVPMNNEGIEIALNTTPIKTKDWQWDLDFTYTRNRSKIVSLHPNVANYIELSGYVNAYDYHIGSVAKVGESYGVLMSDVTQARNENGVPLLEWDDS